MSKSETIANEPIRIKSTHFVLWLLVWCSLRRPNVFPANPSPRKFEGFEFSPHIECMSHFSCFLVPVKVKPVRVFAVKVSPVAIPP